MRVSSYSVLPSSELFSTALTHCILFNLDMYLRRLQYLLQRHIVQTVLVHARISRIVEPRATDMPAIHLLYRYMRVSGSTNNITDMSRA
jgi:hypothetical protein